MKYHHIGIPTNKIQPDETYLKNYKFYCTDHNSNAFGIQWMRYDEDCTLPDIVKNLPHIAFEVDNLTSALEGKKILIEPNSPFEGALVAFILEKGAPVELIEFK